MNGHLFVLRGDLTQLSCDCWLLPTDHEFTIEPGWLSHLPSTRPPVPEAWPAHTRTLRWEGWPANLPQPWLTNTGAEPEPLPWFVEGAVEFVRRASSELSSPPRAGRERPLLGLPLVGTGRGGARLVKGGVVSLLIPALQKELKALNVDIALVVNTPAALAACQAARAHDFWPLSQEEDGLAQRLADHAKSGHLALFFGSGVSAGSGLPSWGRLLEELAEKQQLDAPYRAALDQLNEADQAQVLAQKTTPEQFRERIVHIIDRVQHYSLVHGLMAGLPHREAVTPNYDGLFERACEAAGEPVTVLPYEPKRKGRRWLLKMHGDVKYSRDIVLTREDFLRYRNQRGALAGVVQALLLTRHLLVVGFSLRDENFVSIVDDVRRAVPAGPDREPLGTALLFESAGPLTDLWSREISIASVGSARRLEIFLDRVLACSNESSRHLLDESFSGFLKEPELLLKAKLRELDQLPEEIRELPAWRDVEKLLTQLGKPGTPVR